LKSENILLVNSDLEIQSYLEDLRKRLDITDVSDSEWIKSLPFSEGDTTAGVENELQTAVVGDSDSVDLPLIIKQSTFYKNILKRTSSGDMPKKYIYNIDNYLKGSADNVWENSWVRFPCSTLREYTRKIINQDFLYDKTAPDGPSRSDLEKFIFFMKEDKWLRLPISYLLKISLAEAVAGENTPETIKKSAEKFMSHFMNDNTSPETFSFHPVLLKKEKNLGKRAADETLTRYALTQMLVQYANLKMRLKEHGQEAVVYFSPTPPQRQKQLNDMISDNFYRDIFMSPCLSGWDKGEEKFRYMQLCHQVLSRSQLNAVKKLKEAGIIINNLVVLPNTSNISLANNGTHISLGSNKLTGNMKNSEKFTVQDEKYIGDLVIKMVEHFLPLFVTSYTGAPHKLDYWDFHPEKALGFLSHELDFTHLRMIWRRWKKKAGIRIFGQYPLTPFGPMWLDKLISTLFRLKGDYVPDFRLIDYLVVLMSTENSPALDGNLGNEQMLKKDLESHGVFDSKMSLYSLYKTREFNVMGFSGFEGRFYSQFESIKEDFTDAVNMQNLITLLAYKYILSGQFTHKDIPDTPLTESGRRQIFFGSAISIPTFYIRKDTENNFLKYIMEEVEKMRPSKRYPSFNRYYNKEYRKGLLRLLRRDAQDLIDHLGIEDTVKRLEEMQDNEELTASGRIKKAVLKKIKRKDVKRVRGERFNPASEKYYREDLKKKHMNEAVEVLDDLMQSLDETEDNEMKETVKKISLNNRDAGLSFEVLKEGFIDENLSINELESLIGLTVLAIQNEKQKFEQGK